MKTYPLLLLGITTIFSGLTINAMEVPTYALASAHTIGALKHIKANTTEEEYGSFLNTGANTCLSLKELNSFCLLINELAPIIQETYPYSWFDNKPIQLGEIVKDTKIPIQSPVGIIAKTNAKITEGFCYTYLAQTPEEVAFLMRTLFSADHRQEYSERKRYEEAKSFFSRYKDSSIPFIRNLTRNMLFWQTHAYYLSEKCAHTGIFVSYARHIQRINKIFMSQFYHKQCPNDVTHLINTISFFDSYKCASPLYTSDGSDPIIPINAFMNQEKKDDQIKTITEYDTTLAEIVYQLILTELSSIQQASKTQISQAHQTKQPKQTKQKGNTRHRTKKQQKNKTNKHKQKKNHHAAITKDHPLFAIIKELQPTYSTITQLPKSCYNNEIATIQAHIDIEVAKLVIAVHDARIAYRQSHPEIDTEFAPSQTYCEPPTQASQENVQSTTATMTETANSTQTSTATETSTTTQTAITTTTVNNQGSISPRSERKSQISYAQRVIDQHEQGDLYHSFAWGIDSYIIKYGDRAHRVNAKGKQEYLYSIPGQIEWYDNGVVSKKFVVFTLCFNDQNVVYHRGLTYSKNNLVLDFMNRFGKAIEWPTLDMACDEQSGKTNRIVEEAIIKKDNEFVVEIFDKQLNRNIYLFKVTE